MAEYVNLVKGVCNEDKVIVGYMARYSDIYGWCSDLPDHWMATKSLREVNWEGPFYKRKDAREYLESLQVEEDDDAFYDEENESHEANDNNVKLNVVDSDNTKVVFNSF
jgi:hypothetical protein